MWTLDWAGGIAQGRVRPQQEALGSTQHQKAKMWT